MSYSSYYFLDLDLMSSFNPMSTMTPSSWLSIANRQSFTSACISFTWLTTESLNSVIAPLIFSILSGVTSFSAVSITSYLGSC